MNTIDKLQIGFSSLWAMLRDFWTARHLVTKNVVIFLAGMTAGLLF